MILVYYTFSRCCREVGGHSVILGVFLVNFIFWRFITLWSHPGLGFCSGDISRRCSCLLGLGISSGGSNLFPLWAYRSKLPGFVVVMLYRLRHWLSGLVCRCGLELRSVFLQHLYLASWREGVPLHGGFGMRLFSHSDLGISSRLFSWFVPHIVCCSVYR